MKRLVMLSLVLLFSCSTIRKTSKPMSFDWQGHRGCRGLMPENTIPAMIHAIDLGVTTLEMDAVITKDKQVILSHDTYFNHEITTKPDGNYVSAREEKKLNIFEMTYEQITGFDVGMKLHPKFLQQRKIKAVKPRLADVIDSVEAYGASKKQPPKFYSIETKCKPATDNIYHPKPAEFVELLMQVIKDKKIEARTIIQSFDVRTLQYLHQKYPEMKTSLLVEDMGSVKQHVAKLGFTPTIYSPHYALLNRSVVQNCKQMGMQVIVWTINDAHKMKEIKELDVDGIITDYPNLIF